MVIKKPVDHIDQNTEQKGDMPQYQYFKLIHIIFRLLHEHTESAENIFKS